MALPAVGPEPEDGRRGTVGQLPAGAVPRQEDQDLPDCPGARPALAVRATHRIGQRKEGRTEKGGTEKGRAQKRRAKEDDKKPDDKELVAVKIDLDGIQK